jgi:hypothetical protein
LCFVCVGIRTLKSAASRDCGAPRTENIFWESVGRVFETSYKISASSEGQGLNAVDRLMFCISSATFFYRIFSRSSC